MKRTTRALWTARQRQSHSIHEISYRACFKPQLPAFFIKRFSKPGDQVFDPFMGRGTTPIEAALSGRKAVGLQPEHLYINRQKFTKTANCWKVENNRKGTNTNRIVLLRKRAGRK